jgi:hypothetical protein
MATGDVDSRQMHISTDDHPARRGIPAWRAELRSDGSRFPREGKGGGPIGPSVADTRTTRERQPGMSVHELRLTRTSALGTVRGTLMNTYFYFRGPA